MKSLLMISILIGLIFLSGCTGSGGGTQSTNGLIIKSFIVDPPTVESGEEVFFTLEVENVGGAKATSVNAQIIGLPNEWVPQPGNKIVGSGTLEAPQQGLSGESAIVDWSSRAPPSQTDIKYPLEVIVNYHYATHMETLVRVANRNWIRTLPQNEQNTEINKLGVLKDKTISQGGPIQVEIKVRSGTVYSGSDFTIILDIQNNGNGRPKDDFVTLNTPLSCGEKGQIKLIQGKSRQVRCTISTVGIDTWKNIKVDLDLDYDYFIRKPAEVTVIGTQPR